MQTITYPFVKKPAFLGVMDRNLKKLEDRLGLSLSLRGDCLYVEGDPAKMANAKAYFDKVHELEEKGYDLKENDFHIVLDLFEEGRPKPLEQYVPSEPLTLSRKSVAPKTLNQKEYIQAIREHDVVFGIGPAGTGKTYLAMAMARPSRRASAWASCRATCCRRSTPICDPSTTPSSTSSSTSKPRG
jgi:phosphate starvation-inducible PhoH-like protein